ncbi:MAG TPA: F0F1 ATP synthase subunit B [Phnomibacter sp.]|nr:F0F1 ATP synthase subunit B [Phnomibacter sp.]
MELLSPGLGLIIWNFVAFLVLLFLLKKFAWKPILKSLDERETNIADSIATAEKVKAEMALLQSENEELLVKAREERAEMLKEAKLLHDKIINEARESAKLEGNKIIAEAQVAINNQKMAAITDVKNQVGALVVEVAEKVLQRELANKADQEAYIRDISQTVKLN